MKNIVVALVALVALVCNAAEINTKGLLRDQLTVAVSTGDTAKARVLAETLAALEAADNHAAQRELFSKNNEALTGVLNVYKALPQALKLAQYWAKLEGVKEDSDEFTVLHVYAPAFVQAVKTGAFDEVTVKAAMKAAHDRQVKRAEENRRRWEENRRRMEQRRGGK